MRRSQLLLGILAAVHVVLGAHSTPDIDIVDMWTPVAPYSCFRVPSLIRIPSGKLLAFAESRRGSCGDQAPKDITMVESSDDGKTWTPFRRVVGTGATNHTYRNPYAVWDAPSKTVILQYVNSTLAEPWTNYQITSSDAGATWSAETAITLPKYEGVLPGPGAAIQLSPSHPNANRIVSCGATGYHAGHAMNAVVWFSDDSGKSYSLSPSVFPQFQECQVTQLSNGTLMMNMRNSHLTSCDCRGVALSTDGGSTWGPVHFDATLVEPVCSAGLVTTLNGDVWFSNPATKTSRTHMTVRRSADSGATWPDDVLVWAGPAAYSVLVPLGDNTVGLAFERGTSSPYEHISYTVVGVPK